MERRTFLKSLTLTIPALYFRPSLVLSASNVTAILRNLDIPLSTAGRLSFYVDYSERSTLGDHTFYICRTHGTSGRVTVSYATYGDSHNTASGNFTWEDGEADIKSFTANVSSKPNGDHRIYAKLSSPTGGAVLHNGVKTIAYGVIDDGTIASDSDAVFADFSAASNGTGTRANPYNNPYDAIANVGSKRYIYMKGTHVPNGTNLTPNGAYTISPPTTRTSELTRVYIRNWPGASCVIDGAGQTNCLGVYTKGGESYQTYRGIDFTNLNVTGTSGFNNGSAIFYHYGNSTDINIEFCTANNINGTTNNQAYGLWGVDGGKVWRSTSDNIQTSGSNTNQNTAGLFYYSATNLSVQRCEFSNSASGAFCKRMNAGDVVAAFAFNIFKTRIGIRYGYGSTVQEPNFGIVRGNLFKDCTWYTGIQHTGASANQAGKNWICNNVFDNCGGGDNGAIHSKDTYDNQIFNNIFYNCRKMWDIPEKVQNQSNTSKNQIEYADYNHEYGTTFNRYEYLSVYYKTSAALYAATGLGGNDSSGYPGFTNPSKDDYTLETGSPCAGTGISGTDKGIYLTGIEKLGLSGIGNTSGDQKGKIPKSPTALTTN